MRSYSIILILLLLFSCSKETQVLNKGRASSHLKEISDSTGKKNSLIVDRSVSITSTDLDTAITIINSPLSGKINFRDSIRHFENEDLSIDFKSNRSDSTVTFKVSPKTRIVNARYHRSTTTQNNIIKTEGSKSSVQTNTDLKQDSIFKNVSDQREPSAAVGNIKSIIIWLIVLLIIATACVVILKRKIV